MEKKCTGCDISRPEADYRVGRTTLSRCPTCRLYTVKCPHAELTGECLETLCQDAMVKTYPKVVEKRRAEEKPKRRSFPPPPPSLSPLPYSLPPSLGRIRPKPQGGTRKYVNPRRLAEVGPCREGHLPGICIDCDKITMVRAAGERATLYSDIIELMTCDHGKIDPIYCYECLDALICNRHLNYKCRKCTTR